MKKKILTVLFLLFLLPFTLSPRNTNLKAFTENSLTGAPKLDPQDAQKQKFDYMSSILSRNTKPLGLKENAALRTLLSQPSIKWAMRSESRHLLN